MHLVNKSELAGSDSACAFEGADWGASVSFFLVSYDESGLGPELHRHPYDETYIVRAGRIVVEIDGDASEAGPGDIAVVPANAPHKFTSIGPETAEVVCIHANPRIVREALE